MITSALSLRKIFIFSLLINSTFLFSQNQPFWSNSGNSNVSSTDFLGSINNQSLRLRTNNIERLRINANGYVGVATTNPQYLFDCNGDARFNGTIYAQGIVLATRMQADTFKSASIISVNNNLNFTGGTINNIYTSTGDLRFQSNSGNSGNTLLNVGTNGNVGIGIFSPQYKTDIFGDERVSGKIYSHRIVPLPGDSEIHFGDSSIILSSRNVIYTNAAFYNSTYIRGIGIGALGDYAYGQNSVSIGNKVQTSTTANNSIVIGTGPIPGIGVLNNTIPNSLMIGFNSTLPTIFVAPANGIGTTGAVCIGDTYIPSGYKLAVNGKVIAEDITVKLRGNWPDYVFDSTFVLMPINEFRKTLFENHHLPFSPAASQIQNDGLSFSEIAKAQQKEIEIQALYILQLDARMEAMQKEIDELSAKEKK